MQRFWLILIVISLQIVTAGAQETSSSGKKPSAPPTPAATTKNNKRLENTEVLEAKPASTNKAVSEKYGEGKHWSFYLTTSGRFDSNINHDQDDIDDYGFVGGIGVYFRNKAKNPNFEFEYEIGRQEYKNTSRWDRTSHSLRAWSENKLGKKWISTTRGEISLKGSTEDRELTNRYSVSQFFQYRLNNKNRFNIGGAYRLKRDDDDKRRDSTNPYLEAGYERRFSKGRRKLEFSYRYEENHARNERFDYIRRTYAAKYVTPLLKIGHLDLEARFRPQTNARLVRIELPNGKKINVPRRDKRWIYSADYRYPLSRTLELGLIYKYEQRNSNDPDRNFKAHAAVVVLTYRWWR